MRDYGQVYTCFWTAADVQQLSDSAKLLALYLLSGPHTNMQGCFRVPTGYVAEDLGWETKTVTQAFTELQVIGFISRDPTSGWLWIHNFLKWNPIENPNQGKSIAKLFDHIPAKLPFYQAFTASLLQHQKYLEEPFRNRLETLNQTVTPTVSKPFRNQEQDQEQEQEQEQEQDQKQEQEQEQDQKQDPDQDQEMILVAPNARPCVPSDDIQIVFSHWKSVMNHPHAKLDNKRRAYIRKALQSGYNVTQLCDAITGCSLTPHNIGQNDRNQRYDGLHLILRDADQIDRFTHNAHHPPQLVNDAERLTQSNINTMENWLNKQCIQGEIIDG